MDIKSVRYSFRIEKESPTSITSPKTDIIEPIFSVAATPEEVGRRIRAAREDKHMSRRELANILGHKSTRGIASIENAENDTTLGSILKALNALNLNSI